MRRAEGRGPGSARVHAGPGMAGAGFEMGLRRLPPRRGPQRGDPRGQKWGLTRSFLPWAASIPPGPATRPQGRVWTIHDGSGSGPRRPPRSHQIIPPPGGGSPSPTRIGLRTRATSRSPLVLNVSSPPTVSSVPWSNPADRVEKRVSQRLAGKPASTKGAGSLIGSRRPGLYEPGDARWASSTCHHFHRRPRNRVLRPENIRTGDPSVRGGTYLELASKTTRGPC